MKRLIFITTLLLISSLLIFAGGCDKEKIVESTEYIHEIEYVEMPPDTIFTVDTVFSEDSSTVYISDTVTITETVLDTLLIYDTIVTVENHYDTTVVTDTVLTGQCDPNGYLANTALQYYGNSIVIEYIYSEFLYDDGWIFYLSTFQLDLQGVSTDVYDIYGYIDYWTPDWSAYYPLEFYWRMTFTGGDPADPHNWDISDPPDASAAGHQPGLKILSSESAAARTLR